MSAARPRHLAINADDVDGLRTFYESVLGWTFEPYGSPDFLRCELEGFMVALQRRRELGGAPMRGFECTLAVDDVDAVAAGAVMQGGKVLMERTTVPGVGDLVFIEDPSGNVFGAMEYSSDG
jgi:predicted enzyme related to lactoylglutathione lyase